MARSAKGYSVTGVPAYGAAPIAEKSKDNKAGPSPMCTSLPSVGQGETVRSIHTKLILRECLSSCFRHIITVMDRMCPMWSAL